MIFFDEKNPFLSAWHNLGRAIAKGDLPADILSVQTDAQHADTPYTTKKINVFVRDYTDQDALLRTCRTIYLTARSLKSMACKPDVYTQLKLMSKRQTEEQDFDHNIRVIIAKCNSAGMAVFWGAGEMATKVNLLEHEA